MTREPSVFRALLKRSRVAAGLTQEEMAERSHLSVRTVSDLERGVSRHPQFHTLRSLADALQLSSTERRLLLDAAHSEEGAPAPDGGVSPTGVAGGELSADRPDRVTLPQPVTSEVAPTNHPLPTGGFLGARPTGPLVAREPELDRILTVVKLVQTGSGRLVALAGEAGVGKTRLAQEVSLYLRQRGFVVAAGSCYGAQQATPFFPFLDLLTVLYHDAPSEVRAAVPQRFPYLAALLPDQYLPLPVPLREGPEDQERLFWSVVGFVQACAKRQPLALLLDDLHWADRSSLELLQRLARQTRNHAVLTLVTYRDLEIRQHPLEATLSELTRQDLLEQITVRHLEEEATGQLLAAILGEQDISSEFATLLHERTEGNPFLIQQVLRVLVERGDLYREEGRWTPKALGELEVPESVRSAVVQRVGRLSEQIRQILSEASVLGQTFNVDDLAKMGEHEEAMVEQALDEVRGVGLIREVEVDRSAFDHALTQQVLYNELGTRRRRRLHRAAGRALEQLPERTRAQRIAELAWHFQQGDDPERALRYTMEAGEKAEEIYAYQEAERHYRTALELAQAREDPRSQARAGEKLAFVLETLNRPSEALSVGEDALSLYHALEDVEGEMRVIVVIVQLSPPSHTNEVIPRVERLRDRARASPSPAQAELAAALAWAYFWADRIEDGITVGEQAVALARESGDHRAEQEARFALGFGLTEASRWTEARALYEQMAAVAERTDEPSWLTVALLQLGWVSHQNRDHDQAVRTTERALEVARSTGRLVHIAWATMSLGEMAFDVGEWERATQFFTQAVPLGAIASTTTDPAANLLYLRLLQGDEGTVPGLERLAEDETSWAARYLAEWELVTDQPARARDRLETALEAGVVAQFRRGWIALLGESYVTLGDLEQAEALLGPGSEPSWVSSYTADVVRRQRVMGSLRAAQGRYDDARLLFESAHTEARGFPFAQAQVHHHFGVVLQAQGCGEEARAQLEAAVALFDRLGARPYATRTQAALCSLG